MKYRDVISKYHHLLLFHLRVLKVSRHFWSCCINFLLVLWQQKHHLMSFQIRLAHSTQSCFFFIEEDMPQVVIFQCSVEHFPGGIHRHVPKIISIQMNLGTSTESSACRGIHVTLLECRALQSQCCSPSMGANILHICVPLELGLEGRAEYLLRAQFYSLVLHSPCSSIHLITQSYRVDVSLCNFMGGKNWGTETFNVYARVLS